MGANSMQGLAVLVFLVSFTFLGMSFFYDGNLMLLILFVLTLGASVPLFQKARSIEMGK